MAITACLPYFLKFLWNSVKTETVASKIEKEASYIARTNGKRSFPWRYFVISTSDEQLIENTMTYQLARKKCIEGYFLD